MLRYRVFIRVSDEPIISTFFPYRRRNFAHQLVRKEIDGQGKENEENSIGIF